MVEKEKVPKGPDEKLKDENRRIKRLRFLTSLVQQRICVEDMSRKEALAAIAELRAIAVCMFPGKGDVFDLVIAPRLHRDLYDRFGPAYHEPKH
jgi:hypothetical protein